MSKGSPAVRTCLKLDEASVVSVKRKLRRGGRRACLGQPRVVASYIDPNVLEPGSLKHGLDLDYKINKER